jgi:hypothetical protein
VLEFCIAATIVLEVSRNVNFLFVLLASGHIARLQGFVAKGRGWLEKLGMVKPQSPLQKFTYTDTPVPLTNRFNNLVVEMQEYRRPLDLFGHSLTGLYNVGHRVQDKLDQVINKNEQYQQWMTKGKWYQKVLPSEVSYLKTFSLFF